MTSLARARKISRTFGDVDALADFTVNVDGGSIVGLIGPSGSGKTTAVRLMAGLDRPTTGQAEIFGQSATALHRKDRGRLAFLAQDPALVDELTIDQQVRFAARLRGTKSSAVAEILEVVDLGQSSRTRLSDASGGMRRRAGLAATMVNEPELTFLDEPTAGLDPIVRDQLWDHFRSQTSSEKAMVVTTQHIDEAARCDRVLVLRTGEVVADDSPSRLIAAAGLDETVEIEVEPSDRSLAMNVLMRGLDTADTIQRRGDSTIRIESADGGAAAARSTDILAEASIDILAIDTFTPSLDEVFRAIVENR